MPMRIATVAICSCTAIATPIAKHTSSAAVANRAPDAETDSRLHQQKLRPKRPPGDHVDHNHDADRDHEEAEWLEV